MKVRPLGDKIMVKRVEPEEEKKGEIIIPDTAKEKPQEAKVVALGQGKLSKDGKKRLPFEVKVGDRVFIEKYTGTEVKIDDEEYIIISQDGVLAIIE